jgi:nicotinate-nucleotide--dimethylbenzimidazole phosphoribosyltransferase
MTDTGRNPGEGLPEHGVADASPAPHPGLPGSGAELPANGAPQQPGWGGDPLTDPLPAYEYLEQPAAPGTGLDDEDDVLLMPGPQGSWSDPQPVPPPPAEPLHLAGHISVEVPTEVPVENPAPMAAPAPRRPLHMGPPMPETPSGGVSVRSLADRGPAVAGPPTAGPEYLDVPRDDTSGIPAQQTAEAGWPAPAEDTPSQHSLIPHADSVIPAQNFPAAPVAPVAVVLPAQSSAPAMSQGGGFAAHGPAEGPQFAAAAASQAAHEQSAPAGAEQAAAAPAAGVPVAAAGPGPGPVTVGGAGVNLAAAAEATAPVPAQAPVQAPAPAPVAAPVQEPADGSGLVPFDSDSTARQMPGAAPQAVPAEAVGQGTAESAPVAAEAAAAPEAAAAVNAPVAEDGSAQGTGGAEAPAAAAAPAPVPTPAPVAAPAPAPVAAAAETPDAGVPVAPVAPVVPVTVPAPAPAPSVETAVPAQPQPQAQPAADDTQGGAVAGPGSVPVAPAQPEDPAQPKDPAQPEQEPQAPATEGGGRARHSAGPETVAPGAAATPAAGTPVDPVTPDAGAAAESAQPAAAGEDAVDAAAAAEAAAPAKPRRGGGRRRGAAAAETAVAAEPEAEVAQPEVVQPEVVQPEAQPEAAEPAQPEAAAPEATEPEAAEPEAVQPEAAETETEAETVPEAVTAPAPVPQGPAAEPYEPSVRDAVHRVIRERRDIRNGFRSDPIPHDVLLRVLEAAHTAPSVGHSQPWDFVVIRSEKTREKMHELAMRQREAYAKSLPKARARQFRELKIEAILDTPVNIVVTADPTRGGRHPLGRHTQPQMAPYSSALAVENLWLAARAEGLGVGWVSFFDERQMVTELGLPEHLEVVAYLCVGYVDEFPEEPELMQAGWSQRRPLSWVVHDEEYGNRALPGEEPHDLLEETLRGIRPLDAKALGEAWERQKRMTKPAGALGMLEIISAQLSGLSRQCPPPIPEPAAVAIFAGDHGVHAQGVTSWPQEVTAQMVANFLGGGAVCNAFANQVGAEVCVIDVGVASELPSTPGLLPRKVRPGTADFTTGPAMTREEALRAIEVGIETARDLVAAGNKALLTGEMGIANTTASAAIISVFTGADPAEVTGRGTGINDEMHARKVDVVRRALERHRPDPADPIAVLTAIGGLEHAAMVGLLLGGAALRTPVVLDGVSAGAAALVARAIAPEVLAACIAGHRSAEPGHMAALTTLGLRPLVDLDLRLGEGTGALLALPLVQSAARVMHEVATFDAAGVTEKG